MKSMASSYPCGVARCSSTRRPPLMAALTSILATLTFTLSFATLARADGDPASDYLLKQQVFLVSQSLKAPHPAAQRLQQTVKTANERGFKIRVAVIGSTYDLGAITQLWGKPQTYARFLGIELSLAYKGRLVVVMPDGLGFYWQHHTITSEYRTLSGVHVAKGGAGELAAASLAVRRLAAKSGVSAAGPAVAGNNQGASQSSPPRGSGASHSLGVALLIGAAVAVLASAGLWLLTRRRDHGGQSAQTRTTTDTPIAAKAGGSTPSRRRWALPGAAAMLLIAAGASVIALSSKSSGPSHATHDNQTASASSAGNEPAVVGTPFTWKPGQRPAPEFHLVDQNGRPVSLAAYRGKPTIVTFIDPTCRNLCPLEAKVLNEIDEKLPPSQRPSILAVSVNIYSNTHADLMQDFSRWHLVPQWHWAVGTPAQLKAVWKRYYAEVEVKTKVIAGTTAHYISHSEMSYLIDGKGNERALFSWPFKPQDVERTLQQIAPA